MKVSIITVCYNSEKTIKSTLESILKQQYSNYEYIIIDGGSTDNTINILKEYKKLFKEKMIYISEKDDGIYDAMNKGIKLSSGDIIGILNSDDQYEDITLQEVVDNYILYNSDIISGRIAVIDKNNKIEKILKNNINYKKNIKKRMCINHPATFIKREVYLKNGVFNAKFKIAGDYDLLARLIKSGYDISFIDKCLVKMLNTGISNDKKVLSLLLRENDTIRKKYFTKMDAFVWKQRDRISFFRRKYLW